MNLTQVVKTLEEKYSVDMDMFMDFYKRKLTREDIAKKLEISDFVVRKIGDKLNLIWKKSGRVESFIKYTVELSADTVNAEEALEVPVKEVEYLTHKLNVATAAVQRSRDEANFLRNALRKNTRTDSLETKVLDIIEQALPIKQKTSINISINPACPSYASHVSAALLGDLHVEESVSPKDVGLSNEYNWEIMEGRLDGFFETWFNKYRGETRGVVFILGDIISGIIHDQLESTTKPTAEAVHDLADILHKYISTAACIFGNIDIHFVSGNHERISERIKSTSKGFDFGYLFAQILKAKLSGVPNVEMNISTTGYIATLVNGKVIGAHHGDLHRGPVHAETRTFKVYEAFKSVLGVEINHVFQGHTHQFGYFNTHKGACVVNGSLIGGNGYGHTNGFLNLRPSQTIVQILPNGDIDDVKQVFLD